MSMYDDVINRRTRQSQGENAESEAPVALAQPMGDQASARVKQGESGEVKAENGLNLTDEQKATAMAVMNPALTVENAKAQPVAEEPKVSTYADMYKAMHPELDEEAKAKREKQLKTQKKVAAIGDAISALANMHYTGKSGVNAYDPSATLSGKAKENYDKFLADVKTYEDAHKAGLLRAAELDKAKKEADRKEAKADKRAEVEAGYKKREEDREVAESEAKIKTEEAHQRYYDAYADYYNSGGKKTSGGGSSVNRDVYIIQDDGTKKMFKHSENANNIQAAYAELPKEFKAQKEVKLYDKDRRGRSVLRVDTEGVPVTKLVENTKPTLGEMRQAIEEYNARELKKAGAATSVKKANPMGSGKRTNPMN